MDKLNIFEISSWQGGLADDEDKGIRGAFKFGTNLDIRRSTDSITCNQALIDEGLDTSRSPSASISPSASVSRSPSPSPSLSPSPSTGESPSPSTTPSTSVSLSPSATPSASDSPSPSPSAGLSTVFEDLIRWFVNCSDGYTYGFGNTGHIYRRDSDGVWVWVYKDANGLIKGAEEKPSSTGRTYLYWATNTVLKRKSIPGNSNWNDVEVVDSNLQNVAWHTMKQIAGGLKIANGDMLGLVGYDDSYTNEALDLIPGNIVKTITERNGRAIIGTYNTGYGTKGINAAIEAEYPLAQVGDDGYVYFANMNDSLSVKRFPGGGKVNPGGVCNEIEQVNFFEWEETALSWIDKQAVGNMAMFAVYEADTGYGGIYSYGRYNKNKPFVMNLEYQFDADELGAITSVEGVILVSYRDGTSFGVKKVDPSNKAEAAYYSLDLKAPVKKPSNITHWVMADLFMAPLPANTYVQLWYKMNKTGSWQQARTPSGLYNFNIENAKKATFSISAEGEIFEHKIVLHPSGNTAPEVYRSRVYFS